MSNLSAPPYTAVSGGVSFLFPKDMSKTSPYRVVVGTVMPLGFTSFGSSELFKYNNYPLAGRISVQIAQIAALVIAIYFVSQMLYNRFSNEPKKAIDASESSTASERVVKPNTFEELIERVSEYVSSNNHVALARVIYLGSHLPSTLMEFVTLHNLANTRPLHFTHKQQINESLANPFLLKTLSSSVASPDTIYVDVEDPFQPGTIRFLRIIAVVNSTVRSNILAFLKRQVKLGPTQQGCIGLIESGVLPK